MSQIETTTAVAVLTLIKRPATSADFKNNAEYLFGVASKAHENYNEALAAYQRSVELENITSGVSITFNEGKGDKAEVLSGRVITRLANGTYQVLVEFVGNPAKLSTVKPADVVAIHTPVEAPADATALVPEVEAS